MSRFRLVRHGLPAPGSAVNVTSPTIAGTRGGTLTGSDGTWTGSTSLSRQWYADGVATGNTTTSYSDTDTTKTIEYRVTALPGSIVASGWLGTLLSSGSPNDNFNDNSIDPMWTTGGMYYKTSDSPVEVNTTVAEAGSQARVTPPSATGGIQENGYKLASTIDLTGAAVTITIPLDLTTISGVQQVYFCLGQTKDNDYKMAVGGSTIFLLKSVGGGAYVTVGSTAGYNATNHRRFRYLHKVSDNTFHLQGGPASGPFTEIYSETLDAGISISAARVGFGSNTFGSTTPTTIPFDDFSVLNNLASATLQDQASGSPGKKQVAIAATIGVSGATGAQFKVETEAGALVQGWTALTYSSGSASGTYVIPDFAYEGQKLNILVRNVGGTAQIVSALTATIPYALQQAMRVGINDSVAPYWGFQLPGRDIFEANRWDGSDIRIQAANGVTTVTGSNAVLPAGLGRDNYHGWAEAYSAVQSYPADGVSDQYYYTVKDGLQWQRSDATVRSGVAPSTANAAANGWYLSGLADGSVIGLTADGRPTQLPTDTNLSIAFAYPAAFPTARYPVTVHVKTEPGVKFILRNTANTTKVNVDLVAGTFDLVITADESAPSLLIDRTGAAISSAFFLSGIPSWETGTAANDIGAPYVSADKLTDMDPFYAVRAMKPFGIEEFAASIAGTHTGAANVVSGFNRKWKYHCDLITQAGCPVAWVNAHYSEDNAYTDAMATYYRDHTTAIIYLEKGNEVWNSGYRSSQANMAEATTLGISGQQLYARKHRLMAQRWEAIFTGANAARLIPTVAWQVEAALSELQAILDFENCYLHTKMVSTGPYYGAGIGAGTTFFGPYTLTPADLRAAVAANDRTTFNTLLDAYLRVAVNAVLNVVRTFYDFLPTYSVSKGLDKNAIGYASYEASQHMMVTDPGTWDANLGAGMGARAIDFFGSFKRTAAFGAIEAYYIDQAAAKVPHLIMIHDYVGSVAGYQGWGHMDRTGNRTDHSYSDIKTQALAYNA